MLIAIFSDIHGNREAFEACLRDAASEGAEMCVFLGDLVGYGPDPVWVVETVADLVTKGAIAILGNHDAAVFEDMPRLNPIARAAIDWTRGQLAPAHIAFLQALPMQIEEDDRLYVHANPHTPDKWIYTLDPPAAQQGFVATDRRITLCGHTHRPALFSERPAALPLQHVPFANQPVPLLAPRRWLAVLGAVGQPRDGDPNACYGLFDTTTSRLTYARVPYDVALTARKIVANNLPGALATRLLTGS